MNPADVHFVGVWSFPHLAIQARTGDQVKRLRLFLAASVLASVFVVGSATPASANCVGELVNPCVLICEVGLGNKYTKDLFSFCYIW